MSKQNKGFTSTGAAIRKKPLGLRIWQNRGFYLMFLQVFLFVLIMYYWPMLGIRFSFFEYRAAGRGAMTWVGLQHFQTMFLNPIKAPAFWTSFRNTLVLSVVKLLITTFASVIVSIFLNEMRNIHVR